MQNSAETVYADHAKAGITVPVDKLRIGLLLDRGKLDAWTCRLIKILRDSDYAEIVLVVRSSLSNPNTLRPSAAKRNLLNSATKHVLGWAERFLVGKPGYLPDAFAAQEPWQATEDIEVVDLLPGYGDDRARIDPAVLSGIQSRKLDVLLCLGSGAAHSELLHSARFGAWACSIGAEESWHDEPDAYWEVMEGVPETVSTLQILREDGGQGDLLCRSLSSTFDMSLADTRSNAQWKALPFIPRKLKELRELGAERFFARVRAENACPRFGDRPLYRRANNGELSVLLLKKLLTKVRRKLDDVFFFRQWFLLYDLQDCLSTSLWRFQHMVPPRDRFWADPFVISRDDRYYIFIEEYPYAAHKGHIALIVMHKDGTWESPVKILDAPHHLSYPCLFEFEGELYMIPESKANRSIDLYKCTGFPYEWKFQKHLMEGCKVVDPTVIHWQGKWWMFVSQSEFDDVPIGDELFLYYSENPISGPWTPHPKNPIVSDVRSARPAGRLFEREGRLFRPSQNGSGRYGYGLNICEVITLTESNYEERVIQRIEPKWDRHVVATHSFSHTEGLTVIDGQLRRRR